MTDHRDTEEHPMSDTRPARPISAGAVTFASTLVVLAVVLLPYGPAQTGVIGFALGIQLYQLWRAGVLDRFARFVRRP